MFKSIKALAQGLHMIQRLGGKGPTSTDLAAGGWPVLWGTDLTSAGDEVWAAMSTAEREKAYSNLDVVFTCVREIYTTFSEPELTLGYDTPDGFKTMDAHPALALLEHPNQFYTRQKFEAYFVARLILTGESFVWKWRNALKAVAELWPTPSSWCKVVPGLGSDAIASFTVRQASPKGHESNLPVVREDMMYEWLVDPASTTRGVGCIQASQHAYQVEGERENLIAEQLQHSHVPGMVVTTPEGVVMDGETKQYFRDYLKDRIGKGHRGGPLPLQGGAKVEFPNVLKDLDMHGLASMNESRICAAFGVPPIIAGLRVGLENSPWSKYSEARKSFYEETMMPLWTMAEQAYTRSLLRDEGEDQLRFHYDTTALPALQPDRREQAEVGAIAYKSGAILKNEYREVYLGLDARSDGNVYQVPISVFEQPAGDKKKEEAA